MPFFAARFAPFSRAGFWPFSGALLSALLGLGSLSPFAVAAPPSSPSPESSGVLALWYQGDAVTVGTLLLMLGMSIACWSVLLRKWQEQARLFAAARRVERDFWQARSLEAGLSCLSASNPFRGIVESGLKAIEHCDGPLLGKIDGHSWITLSLQRRVDEMNNQLQSGLAVLATVASTAPFVGLFGTVWGIYHALRAISLSGQASLDKIAGPVGEALIMTALGLAVAVPAVMGYNLLVRRNRLAQEQIRAFAGDIHAVLLGAEPQ